MSGISSIKKIVHQWFTAHPESLGETYMQHFKFAVWIGLRSLIAGFAVLLHAVFPFIFEATATQILKNILYDVEKRKNKKRGDN